ncbi:Protein ALP1-like [Bienertia sinuspersici]
MPCFTNQGGLVATRNVTMKEIAALFLHILAHDLKNRTIQAILACFGETVSHQLLVVLRSILKFRKALDGTHIKKTVPVEDHPRYRDRMGDISTDVLATCNSDLRFTYVLPGWEGSTSDPLVLRDALRRPNGLSIPRNKCFLVDLGFSNCEGFLAPYKGTHYHLICGGGTLPKIIWSFSTYDIPRLNTIERAFRIMNACLSSILFKGRKYGRNKSYARGRTRLI